MSEVFIDTPQEPATNRTQLVAAILLGLAATLTAFSAYNASLKDGEALQGYTASNRTLNDANSFFAQGNQTFALDQQLFVSYVTAVQDPDGAPLAEYLKGLMRKELVAGIEWWEPEANTAPTPFDDVEGNPYTVADFEEANALEDQAAEEFDAAVEDDDTGDRFELATVFFALTLFFGGVATLFARRRITSALLVIGLVTLVVGAGAVVTTF
jgi:hypothetical protein